MVTDRLQSEPPSSPEPCFPGIQMGLSENRPIPGWFLKISQWTLLENGVYSMPNC